MESKFEIAITKKQFNNCLPGKEHKFSLVQNEEKKEAIRLRFPQLINPLWECSLCDKITESN